MTLMAHKLDWRPELSAAILLASIILLGLILGYLLSPAAGEAVMRFPPVRAVEVRVRSVAESVREAVEPALQPRAADYVAILAGILYNNALIATLLLILPPISCVTKMWIPPTLERLYHKPGLGLFRYLFKPLSWKPYRVLIAILPCYASALFSFMAGILLNRWGLELYAYIEAMGVFAASYTSLLPAWGREPKESLGIWRWAASRIGILAYPLLLLAAALEAGVIV